MNETRHLYRPSEAAESLGISRARLYQLMARGEIGSVKIGVSRRIPAVDLARYVDRLRAEQGSDTADASARGAATAA